MGRLQAMAMVSKNKRAILQVLILQQSPQFYSIKGALKLLLTIE